MFYSFLIIYTALDKDHLPMFIGPRRHFQCKYDMGDIFLMHCALHVNKLCAVTILQLNL